MTMKLTMKKITTETYAKSIYAVLVDGRQTSLNISKGAPAKYRLPQEWDVCVGNHYLFSAKGLSNCMEVIQTIIGEIVVDRA